MQREPKERFKLTRPKNKNGEEAFYFEMLDYMKDGMTIPGKYVRESMMKNMTFQALREKGLVNYSDGVFSITENGKKYVAVVKSTNKVPRAVLKALMK